MKLLATFLLTLFLVSCQNEIEYTGPYPQIKSCKTTAPVRLKKDTCNLVEDRINPEKAVFAAKIICEVYDYQANLDSVFTFYEMAYDHPDDLTNYSISLGEYWKADKFQYQGFFGSPIPTTTDSLSEAFIPTGSTGKCSVSRYYKDSRGYRSDTETIVFEVYE